MRVYIITIMLVVLFCRLAESQTNRQQLSDSHYIKNSPADYAWLYFFLAACVLVFVTGFRYRVGTDYGAYYNGYTSSIENLNNNLFSLNEPGFGFLAWVSTRFYNDGAAVIFTAALVTVSLALIVIYRNTDHLTFSLVLYIILGCWHGCFNGIRQYLAASILFCGYRFIKERHFVKYCLVVFIAFLFHRSAIVMFAAYFFVHRKINLWSLVSNVIAIAVILFSYDRLFSFAGWIMDSTYSANEVYTVTEVNRIRVVAACIPAIVFLISYWKEEINETDTFFLNITILHALVRIFTMNSALLYRIGIYTSLFQAIAIPYLLKKIPENNRKIITAGILFMYTGMWLYEISISGSLNKFQWIWQRI